MKYLFSFPFVLSNLDININNSDSVISQLAYGVFLLSLVALFCFINILAYINSYYIIQKGNNEFIKNYPNLKKND